MTKVERFDKKAKLLISEYDTQKKDIFQFEKSMEQWKNEYVSWLDAKGVFKKETIFSMLQSKGIDIYLKYF